jgi:7,8-dihydropterin-6-yl-methyl-4-(beta-D-ribofuranosyl)aminobenzene 5'-phosphate synthase
MILIIALAISIMPLGTRETGRRTEMNKTGMTLTTLYDNYQHDPGLRTGWGFSCLVGAGGKSILFDTGADSQTLLYNMGKLGIEPGDIDLIALSHIHGDHTGGLEGILEANPNVTVYVLKSFPGEFKETIESSGSGIVEVSGPMGIAEGVSTAGELGTWIREQSLVINTERGLVVLTGCAHPGIVDIVRKVKETVNGSVYLVMGGFHLSDAGDDELGSVISSLRGLGVEKAGPCHCSGERARELFREEYGDGYIANGVGMVIEV